MESFIFVRALKRLIYHENGKVCRQSDPIQKLNEKAFENFLCILLKEKKKEAISTIFGNVQKKTLIFE